MSSIGGRYIGIPCGGEKMPMFAKKGNDIDEAQKEAYRKEGDKRTVERIAEKMGMLSGAVCPPGKRLNVSCLQQACDDHWLKYLTEDSQ